MAGCGDIELGSTVVTDDCDLIPAAGTIAEAIVMNFKDVAAYVEEDGYIVDIILKPGKVAYKFTGYDQVFTNSEDFGKSPTTGRGNWKHKNGIVIYERTQLQKNNIKRMSNGRFVVVVFNRGLDVDAITLAGKKVGVQLAAGTIRASNANDNMFMLAFETPPNETENEIGPMQTIGPDQASAIAMLESLLVASDEPAMLLSAIIE